jgi:hypothetical protein
MSLRVKMADVAIDRSKTARVAFYVPLELRERLDGWRSQRRPIPSESAAVVQLLRRALDQADREDSEREREERDR